MEARRNFGEIHSAHQYMKPSIPYAAMTISEPIESGQLIVELLLKVLSQLERPIKALSDEEVAGIVGISRSAVWALCTPGSATYDERFPKPRKCRTLRRTVWNSNELQQYLEDLFSEPGAQGGQADVKQRLKDVTRRELEMPSRRRSAKRVSSRSPQ